jgi:hypothetical protein
MALEYVQISWYYEQFMNGSTVPGALQPVVSNVHGSDRFLTTITILDLSNVTFGPVVSRFTIRHVDGQYEAAYSCVSFGSDVKDRQYEACLIVLGKTLAIFLLQILMKRTFPNKGLLCT